MPQFSYPELKIELDQSDGGALTDVSKYVTEINGWTKERLLEELTGAGEATDRWGDVAFLQKSEVVLTGPYDDTALSLVAITRGWSTGAERSLRLTFDVGVAADVQNVECLLSKVERKPSRGKMTQWVVTLRPTGAIT